MSLGEGLTSVSPSQILNKLDNNLADALHLGKGHHELVLCGRGKEEGVISLVVPHLLDSRSVVNSLLEFSQGFYEREGFCCERRGKDSFSAMKSDERYFVIVSDARNPIYSISVNRGDFD